MQDPQLAARYGADRAQAAAASPRLCPGWELDPGALSPTRSPPSHHHLCRHHRGNGGNIYLAYFCSEACPPPRGYGHPRSPRSDFPGCQSRGPSYQADKAKIRLLGDAAPGQCRGSRPRDKPHPPVGRTGGSAAAGEGRGMAEPSLLPGSGGLAELPEEPSGASRDTAAPRGNPPAPHVCPRNETSARTPSLQPQRLCPGTRTRLGLSQRGAQRPAAAAACQGLGRGTDRQPAIPSGRRTAGGQTDDPAARCEARNSLSGSYLQA